MSADAHPADASGLAALAQRARLHLRLARARLARARLRPLALVVAIALGMSARIATDAIARTIRGAFAGLVDATRSKADLTITRGELGLEADAVERLDGLPGLAHVAGVRETVTTIEGERGPVLVVGVELTGDRYFLPVVASSSTAARLLEDPLPFLSDPRAVLVSSRLAARLGVRAGGRLRALGTTGPVELTVAALVDTPGLDAAFDGAVLVLFSDAAELTFGAALTRVDVALADGVSRDDASARIRAALGDGARVELPAARARHLTSILGPIGLGLDAAGFVALLVGALLVVSAVTVEVAERRRELGLLRALGATRQDVRITFVVEVVLLALAAGLVAPPLARGLAELGLAEAVPAISRFYLAVRPPPPALALVDVALGVGLGVVLAAGAAWFAAGAATRVEPSSGLRAARGELAAGAPPRRALALVGLSMIVGGWAASRATPGDAPLGIVEFGVVALGGALVVPIAIVLAAPPATRLARLVLGASGALGIQAAAARRDRTALTVGALLVAVAASVALSTWSRSLEAAASSWLGRALPADLYVTQGSVLADQHNVPLDAELWPRLLALPGVGEAYPVRTVSVDVGARRVLFIAFDTRAYEAASRRRGTGLEVLAGALPSGLLAERPAVAVAENAAHKLGLKPGDVLQVPGRAGPVALEVVAIIRDYASEEGTIAIDRRWLVELFGDERVDSVDLVLADGASLDGVRAELRRVLGDGGHVFVVAQAEVREEVGRVLGQFLAIFRGVELVALQVALLGVASALFAAVLDRRRELALLAALGATRSQLAALVLAEATFVGLVAAVLGVLVGTPLGAVLVTSIAADTTGWRLEVAFPGWAALRVGALGVLTAIVAALVPARWAATHALRGGVGGVD